jgi:hypothetical protein
MRNLTVAEFGTFRAVDNLARTILAERGLRVGPIAFNNDERTSGEDVISLLKETGARLAAETSENGVFLALHPHLIPYLSPIEVIMAGKHRKDLKGDPGECPECQHEAHEEGACYHCGIFSDQLPSGNHPCITELGV